ncbi:hypothetical protein LAZ67_17001163 [Cordylochernes scorpioides]|uniref:GIY-YIG domain-containing protein n=1 Tax=Cordylochernes scorpioides TaxID=51811 RepID=A0ABY6LE40_9ARAC|nr:hypothetical protein LAZ67_17001163 [Cordylochernes scorpioides]
MPQPPYSPDLAPCDFFLFPKLKRPMKGRRYATLDEIETASKEELNKIKKNDFLKCFEDWKNRWHKYQPNQNLRSIFRHPDTKQIYKPEDRANVVYKIPCKSCQAIYIGETSKPLSERINQHKSALKNHNPTSLLVDHAFSNSHTPDFDHTSIIHQNIK